jgi:hypothetical protein
MAELTMAIAMSHGPMVVSEVPTWHKIAELDRDSTLLRDTTGRPVTFQQLEEATGNQYADLATEERWLDQREQVKASLARLKQEVASAGIDLFLVIGDDQYELFNDDNMPSLAVYHGAELEFTPTGHRGRYGAKVGGLDDVHRGYGVDKRNRWPGHEGFAVHLIGSLIERHFDVAVVKDPKDPSGLGHAFGIVEIQLMETPGDTALVPLILNSYWPPNQLTPARCWEVGLALRAAIESYPEDLRVAVVASGGLSHFVTDEDLDMKTLEPLRAGDGKALVDLPPQLLNSGNSEVRNWIALAACSEDLPLAWDEYIPVYRTACGTGCGMAFARWGAIPEAA